MIEQNPWTIARPCKDESEVRHGRAFTKQEIGAILECASRYEGWETATMLGLYTGLRRCDVKNIKWSAVDFKNKRILWKPSKTARHGIEVGIPLHPKLEKHLKKLRDDGHNEDEVIISSIPREINCKDAFPEILRLCGITDGAHKLSFHCLRHTFATRLSEAGAPLEVRKALCGHTQDDTAGIYNHDWNALAAAVNKLE